MKSLKQALIKARLLDKGLTLDQIRIAELTHAGMNTLSIARLMRTKEALVKADLSDFYSRFDVPKLPRGKAA